MIVADANLLIPLFVPSPLTDAAEAVLRLDDAWVAPPLILSELRSALWKYVQQERLALHDAIDAVRWAQHAALARLEQADTATVFRLALQSKCTPYDCEYVALAMQHECSLVTSDADMLQAFPGHALSPRDFVNRMRPQRGRGS